MPPPRILLATGNAHKAQEIRAILAALLPEVKLVSLADLSLSSPPDSIESGSTFGENACAKAVWYAELAGLPCIADDSGLCVECLGGAPGIHSARWAGPADTDRNRRLLEEMQIAGAVTSEQRRASFVCVVAYAPCITGEPVINASGILRGVIVSEASGDGGFGYDPLFYLPNIGCTLAEAGETVKNTISHRAVALRRLARRLHT